MLDAHRRGQRERLHRHRLKPVLACGACQARLLAETDADRRALNQRMANLLDLLGDCARLYHRAPNCLKKLLNRVCAPASFRRRSMLRYTASVRQ